MNWDDGLTGTALEIAKTDATPLRVMAGPGTGKSFAMKRRVARLLESGYEPSRLLALTFTRNAADSLIGDLHTLGIAGCEKIQAGTLHSLCFRILNREDVFKYLDRVPRPLITFNKSGSLQFEGGAMLNDLVHSRHFGSKRDCAERIRAFEAAWARLQSDDPGWTSDTLDREFQDALISWLRFHRAILIGELVPETLRFLRGNPASDVYSGFDCVIVDEYQDLNKAEQSLIDLIAGNNLFAIVGDADQSIYRFRHANPEGINDFSSRHPSTYNQTLDECRRCPQDVVVMANYLIKHNHAGEQVDRLRYMPENPRGSVRIVQWLDTKREASGLAGFVKSLVDEFEYKPSDILITTPRRLLGYGIRDCISQANVPVHSFFSEEPLESDRAQRAFAVLALLANPEDRVALRWFLGSGSNTGLAGQYLKLRQHCEQTGDPPRSILDAIVGGTFRLPGTSQLTAKYRELINIIQNYDGLDLVGFVDQLLPEGDDDLNMLREIALSELSSIDSVNGLYDRVKASIVQPDVPEGEFVRVMSLHKSKGLTSKITIVAGCIQDLIPNKSDDNASPDEQRAYFEEQRRLFYVAITRCTEMLVLSSTIRMDRQLAHKMGVRIHSAGRGLVNVIASPFMHELGPCAPDPIAGADWEQAGYR